MNYFLKKQFSFGLVFFLLIINIAAISTILYHIYSEKSTSPTTSESHDVGKIITGELGLTPEQNKLFQDISKSYNIQSQKILDQLTQKRSEMLAELSEEIPDTTILHNLAKEIGELHTKLKLLTINDFLESKKICTPAQQQQLSKLYNDMLETEGHFKGNGKQYRYRYRHGQLGGKGQQKND
jgi:Spy/CpxP family protein refolding chaperone